MSELAHVHHERVDGVEVARIEGEVDISNAELVRGLIMEGVTSQSLGLVLDLSGTRYLDSSGVRVLFELTKQLETSGRRLTVVVPKEARIRRVLEIVGYRPLHPTRERALDDVRGGPGSGS